MRRRQAEPHRRWPAATPLRGIVSQGGSRDDRDHDPARASSKIVELGQTVTTAASTLPTDTHAASAPGSFGRGCGLAVALTALVLLPLLLGFEPVGNDPDLLYRPYKTELQRALRDGHLPWWSDRFALGIPLVAESHVAALYPANIVLYGLLPLTVDQAYRLSQWLHGLALAAAVFAYGSVLGLSRPGAVLAGLVVALGGYAAAHAVHEPFVNALPYVPLGLLLTERWLATGRAGGLAGLALAWGAQITLGHFQLPVWTAALVVITALVRLANRTTTWRRAALVGAGLVWGLAVAALQLGPTAELSRVAGFRRPAESLMGYACPPAHLAQWTLPALYQGRNDGPVPAKNTDYWGALGTTPEEAGGHVGVMALVLACLGFVAASGSGAEGRRGGVGLWRGLSLLGLFLATLAPWWPDAYRLFLALPGLGWFRAPGRHQLLPALGLALLAGRGLDRTLDRRRFALGLGLAVVLGVLGWAWTVVWVGRHPEIGQAHGPSTLPLRWLGSALAWLAALVVVVAWRIGRVGPWAPIATAALELAALYYVGPTTWGQAVDPAASPILQRLLQEPDAPSTLVAGRLQDLPVRLGLTAAYPVLGITAPPPNYLLERAADTPPALTLDVDRRWQRRFGVGYGVWAADDPVDGPGITRLLDAEDPVLERLLPTALPAPRRQRWQLVRYDAPAPPARVVTAAREVVAWGPLYARLSRADLDADTAWFLSDDVPAGVRRTRPSGLTLRPDQDSALDLGPTATAASYDPQTGTVTHDGSCLLILRRTWYPGWSARINGRPDEVPLTPVNGGLQALVLRGSGPSRIELIYRPTARALWAAVSILAGLGALATIGLGLVDARRAPAPGEPAA